MASFINMPLVAEWLRQIDPDDRPAATRLVEAIMLVNLDYFFSGVRTRILEQAGTARCPIGLYVEREIRKWRGEPNRLFREATRRGRVTSYGAGPRPVLPAKTINPEVGSEGLLAWLATEICREHPNEFISHPGPDQIRANRIKTFLLLTDFMAPSQCRAREPGSAPGDVGDRTVPLGRAWRATFASSFRSQGTNANAAAIALREDPHPAAAELFRPDQDCPPSPNATEGRTGRSKKRQGAGLLAYRSAQRDAREPLRRLLSSKRFNF